MNSIAELSALPTVLTAVFLVSGAAITLIGSLGLLRIKPTPASATVYKPSKAA